MWISLAYTPIEGDDGEVLGFHCTFHETTAALLAEQQRDAELDRLRAMFDQAPGFIALLTGPDHVVTLSNAAYARLVGGRDVNGKPIAEALPEAIEQGFVSLLDQVYRSGERYVGSRLPLDIDTGDGERQRRHVDFVYQPVRDGRGFVTGIFVEGSEVTTHHVAEMFTQVDQSLDRADGGLGIGLTLVRNLVDLHGGSVEAHSEGLGHGSEFVVRLPLAPEDAPIAPHEADTRATRPNPPRHRVLVVDDVEPSANTLALMLEALGQTPRAVYDGMSALAAMRSFEPDVVFLDIAMPGMDGYELARRIRAGWPRCFLVALTGYGQEGDRRRAFDAGFDHHLFKPTHLEALRELLFASGARTAG